MFQLKKVNTQINVSIKLNVSIKNAENAISAQKLKCAIRQGLLRNKQTFVYPVFN